MSKLQWMIYGANGYTGELIAREARKRGLSPILAGRSKKAVQELAVELGLTYTAFSLDNPAEIRQNIQNLHLVLHCAGPFSQTHGPMVQACIDTKTHYLDITGEFQVFENSARRGPEAARAGVLLCPGVGFDVIPTDCVAACLKEALPLADRLTLAFDSRSRLSRGTAKTSVESLGLGGRARVNGALVKVPLGTPIRRIDFGDKEKDAVRIPWGDVSTAYHSTGIPNIEVYMGIFPAMRRQMTLLRWLRPLLALPFAKNIARKKIDAAQAGPTEGERITYTTQVWGEAVTAGGDMKTARLSTANGYEVTVEGSLAVVAHLLQNQPEPGFQTPSRLMGPRFVETLPGSSAIEIS